MDILYRMSTIANERIGIPQTPPLPSKSVSATEALPNKTPARSTGEGKSALSTPRKRPRRSSSLQTTMETRTGNHLIEHSTSLQDYIDTLSSDSSLSDFPSDLESVTDGQVSSNPSTPLKPAKVQAVKVRRPTKSPYFPKQPPPKRITCLPFPPLSAQKFGLMQERLAHDPFRLLVATIFLNRTRGEQAMPVYFQLMERYPTIEALADANVEDIISMIHKLGFQNQRAKKCVALARVWLKSPPGKGKRYRKINYPTKGDGHDLRAEEVVDDEDERVAWEIAGLPGLGAYALDSWRIFCRDELRGLSGSWNGEGAADSFEAEWKRVVPTDKELRAYLTWMWLKLGWIWNKETGERTEANEETMKCARAGGVVHDEGQFLVLVSPSKIEATGSANATVEKTAGSFLPGSI